MALWYASLIPGTEGLAAQLFKEAGSAVTTLSGALLITSDKPPSAGFLNNVFRVLVRERCADLPDALHKAAQRLDGMAFPKVAGATFRLIVMDSGTLRAVPPHTMERLERLITRASGLAPRRANPDVEVWLNLRTEGFYTLMLRLDKHRPFDKSLAPGQLRPDLCALLAALAPPGRAALDPFAGSGALAAALRPAFNKVFALDIDPVKARALHRAHPAIRSSAGDARQTGLDAASIDAVVTDPPWGLFERIDDIAALYDAFLAEAHRVLRPGGTLVMLTAYDGAAAALHRTFGAHEAHPVLISGKQAVIYRARKAGGDGET